MLLNESCVDTAVSAHKAIAKRKSSFSLSRDSDNEKILKLDNPQAPEPLKVKSYSEASSALNHVSDFSTAQGESNLADELCKIISKARSLYVKNN